MLTLILSPLWTSSPWKTIPAAVLIVLVAALVGNEIYRQALRIPNFKGPTGAPIVGNLWQIYGQNAAKQYHIWSKTYGPVYQIQLGNKPVLVMNTAAAAKEILAANPAATSSRPVFYTFHQIVSKGFATTIGTSPHSEALRRRRKVLATALNKPSVARHLSHIDTETKQVIREAYDLGQGGKQPIDPIPLFLRMNMSMGFTLHWGTRVANQNELFREIVAVEEGISNARSTSRNFQNYVPLLRISSLWSGKSPLRSLGARRHAYMSKLDHDLDQRMEKGTNTPSVRVDVRNDPDANLSDEDLRSLNVTMTGSGLDTMQATLAWCIAVLAMRQDIQDKALTAIRKTFPSSQPLCDPHDPQLVDYVMAFVRELIRFYPASRLALPRETTSDIFFHGKHIPRGTMLFLNAWACNRDPELWSDGTVFRPERWLEYPETTNFAFGMGSRMCIGQHLAQREIYTVLTRLINSFHIESPSYIELDSVEGVGDRLSTVSAPFQYKVTFTPRDPEALSEALA